MYKESPLLDGHGILFTSGTSNGHYEISLYYQNGTGVVCNGGPPIQCKYEPDGEGTERDGVLHFVCC
jgi:hypothetical protein